MIRLAVVGAGPNGAGHARAHAASGRARVEWVVDPDPRAAALLAAEVGARPTDSLDQAIEGADAVIVASPNPFHHAQALAVLAAGRALFLEKPPALTLAETREIAAAGAGGRNVVGFTVRKEGTMRRMLREAASGDLGRVVSLGSRRVMRLSPPEGHWRSDPALSGGVLLEISLHELDWILLAGGPVRAVSARVSPDSGWVWARFDHAGGATGWHEGSWNATHAQFFRSIQGEDGGIATNEWGNVLYRTRPGEDRTEVAPDAAFDLRGHFLDVVEGACPSRSDLPHAVAVMELADACLRSSATGETVRLGG